jgi:uncharacterized membrane protein YfcA
LEWYEPILILLAGFVAGIINTLAGSGSVVTISLLVFLGLDPKMANGTNRIGVLLQSITGAKTFIADKSILPKSIGWQLWPSIAGAIVGSLIATEIDDRLMGTIIGWLFVVLLYLIIMKPKEWLRKEAILRENSKSFISVLMFFGIGIYGGFIQAGVGIFLLSALVLYAGYTLNTSNAIKLICVTAFTIPALAIFVWKGQVIWMYGLLMAVGQMFGAYIAARFAMNHEKANLWVRRLLIVVIIISIIKFLRLYEWFAVISEIIFGTHV